jgi:hypothetical protein
MESLTAPAAAREGEWSSRLAVFVAGLLLFETISGLSIWLLPFSVPNQFSVLLHTLGGLLFLVPFLIYQTQHWLNYRSRAWSHYLLTGYVAFAAVTINAVSGVILTVQGLLATRISYFWDMVHIVTTVAIVAFLVPHIVIVLIRDRQSRAEKAQSVLRAERNWVFGVLGITVVGYVILGGMTWFYQPTEWANEFPADYEYDEELGPFRPSLATTASGGAYDDRSLTGSASCGSRDGAAERTAIHPVLRRLP